MNKIFYLARGHVADQNNYGLESYAFQRLYLEIFSKKLAARPAFEEKNSSKCFHTLISRHRT